MRKELSEYKKQLVKAKYQILAYEAIVGKLQGDITFGDWVNLYGLYCSGIDVQADTVDLGSALLEARILSTSDFEQSLVEANRNSIKSNLDVNKLQK